MRKRSKFELSHVNSLSCKMGYIVPIMLQECLPGDTFQADNKIFCRVAPLVAPVMHKVWIDVVTVWVANRMIWDNWETFITGGPDGNDASVPPTITMKPTVGSLADYFGLPLSSGNITVSALPFRAYALAYNELFRDQDLQEELPISKEDGPDTTTSTALQRAAWQKDYFTTCRLNPQKGAAVSIPVSAFGGITGSVAITPSGEKPMFQFNGGTSANPVAEPINVVFDKFTTTPSNVNTGFLQADYNLADGETSQKSFLNWYTTGLDASFTSTTPSGLGAISIDDFRQAMALQRYREKRSLFGSRYEDLLHFWGLRTQDSRLQLPEVVAVKHGQLQFSEVLQTSADESNTGVGSMYGHGIGAVRSGRWRYYCWEHGWLMSFMIVRPQAVYTQGIERMWTRAVKEDYWTPEYQHIGQQEVLKRELFADGSATDTEVFGYQNRYDEYRRGKNHVTGEFRTTLDYWNMARIFENAPNLNGEFITCNPTDRVYQLSAELSDQLYVMVQNDVLAKRLMSRNGNPI